jgi:coenzyme F420-0:L-glutamate ligase/coenzyme F420-1:gamma-L-glutamate ligase
MVSMENMGGTLKGICLWGLPNIPEIEPGADLVSIILDSLASAGHALQQGDVLVIAQKIVSKAEGRLVNLASVSPGPRARIIADEIGKDPRLVELILQESKEISRSRPGLLIVRHRLGFTSANAGIDRSNVPQQDSGEFVLLLPEDPDASAGRIREALARAIGVEVGIIISDSHGRPFRLGIVGVAIGVAGLKALWDRRGEVDRFGYELVHTEVATADEMAAAAGLVMGQADEGTPVVLVRGLAPRLGNGKASDLIRPPEQDLYR